MGMSVMTWYFIPSLTMRSRMESYTSNSKNKNWRTPLEISTGHTPDISMFRFHFWEPIWFFETTKSPFDNWRKWRFLGFAESTGDLMTYWIEKEDEDKPQMLVWSGIRTRRNINDKVSDNDMNTDNGEDKSLNNDIDEDGNDDFNFQSIMGHEIRDGFLYFQVQYNNECGIQNGQFHSNGLKMMHQLKWDII